MHNAEKKTKTEVIYNYKLWSIYIWNKKWNRIGEWDNLSEIMDGFKKFVLATINISNRVSKCQENLLIPF